jgi:hypothetical protein
MNSELVSETERNVEFRTADSMESVLSHCMELRKKGYWSFRGQRNHEWFAEPHIGSVNTSYLAKTMQNFRARCMEFPRPDYIEDTNNKQIKEWRWLFYAQHHRLKTQLLDWTSNPLVALYFAVEDILSRAKEGTLGAVWALQATKTEKFMWEQDLNRLKPYRVDDWLLIRPAVVTHRIARQSGLFTIHSERQLDGAEVFCKSDHEKKMVKIQIVPLGKSTDPSLEIRRKLGFMNIHHAALFPHPDGVANFINEELPDLDPIT